MNHRPNVNAPAVTWLLVTDETNRPRLKNAAPIRKTVSSPNTSTARLRPPRTSDTTSRCTRNHGHHHHQHAQRRQVFAEDDLAVAQRVRQQQLHGAAVALLGQQPHRHQRADEHDQRPARTSGTGSAASPRNPARSGRRTGRGIDADLGVEQERGAERQARISPRICPPPRSRRAYEIAGKLALADGPGVSHRATSRRRGPRPVRGRSRARPSQRPPGRLSSSVRAVPRARLAMVSCATMRPAVDDQHPLAHHRHLRQDVRARAVRCVPGQDRLMTCRISMIWRGSRPTVGSSRISTGGSPISACARPTRCR